MSDAAFAAFDRNGRYLYFTASTDVGPVLASSMAAFKVPVTRSGYVIVLGKDLKSPLAPQSDEEKMEAGKSATAEKQKTPPEVEECSADAQSKGDEASRESAGKNSDRGRDKDKDKDKDSAAKKEDSKSKEPPLVRIDFDNIDQRILALPFPTRNYGGMIAGKTHILFLLEGPAVDDGAGNGGQIVHKFELCTRKTDKLLDNIGNFFVSANGEKALYEQLREPKPRDGGNGERPHGTWSLKAIDALGKPSEPNKPDGSLKLDAMEVEVDPRAEWQQMYREVWRI
jgi:tricorn protease